MAELFPHPEEAYLQGKSTELATFSIAKLRMDPNGPRQVGQHVSFGRQLLQTRWPLWHWRIGVNIVEADRTLKEARL